MELVNEHNVIPIYPQDVLPDEPLDRLTAFKIWQLTKEGRKISEVAEKLGLTPSAVSLRISGERISSVNHRDLVEAGIPARLLPPIEDVKTGPKPKQ